MPHAPPPSGTYSFRLAAVHHPQARQPSVEYSGRVKIGRDLTCDISFPDGYELISRVHAEVRATHEGVFFVDVESRNGSFLDGARVRTVQLAIGREYTFLLGGPASPTAIAITALFRPDHPAAPMRTVVQTTAGAHRTIIQPEYERLGFQAGLRQQKAPNRPLIENTARAAPQERRPQFDRLPSVVVQSPIAPHVPSPPSTDAHRSIPTPSSKQLPYYEPIERRPYRVAHILGNLHVPAECYKSDNAHELARMSLHVLSEEAPITIDLLAYRIAPAWGMKRGSAKLCNALVDSLQVYSTHVLKRDGVLWLSTAPPHLLTYFRVPTADDRSKRAADQIPLPEVGNALLYCMTASPQAKEPLLRHAAQQLGYTKIGIKVRTRLELALRTLARHGRAYESDGLWIRKT